MCTNEQDDYVRQQGAQDAVTEIIYTSKGKLQQRFKLPLKF